MVAVCFRRIPNFVNSNSNNNIGKSTISNESSSSNTTTTNNRSGNNSINNKSSVDLWPKGPAAKGPAQPSMNPRQWPPMR